MRFPFNPDFDLTTARPSLPPDQIWALSPLVRNFAIIEDVRGPDITTLAGEAELEAYQASCAKRLPSVVIETLAGNHLAVPEGRELDHVCEIVANIAVVIRWLGAAVRRGEVSLGVVQELPFYNLFSDYLTDAPEIIARRQELAIASGLEEDVSPPEPEHSQYKLSITRVPSNHPTPPEVYRALQPVILQFAVFDDFTGPLCRDVDKDLYTTAVTERVRPYVLQAFKTTKAAATDQLISAVMERTANEIFVVRGLNEARLTGEITLGDIKEVELFDLYDEYFQGDPPYLDQVFAAAQQAGITPLRQP